jgi:hypothetical protein
MPSMLAPMPPHSAMANIVCLILFDIVKIISGKNAANAA